MLISINTVKYRADGLKNGTKYTMSENCNILRNSMKTSETASPVKIVGIDNLNDNYDVSSKDWRLVPYFTDDKVDNPVSLCAAAKKSNDLMAHAYSKLYNTPSTGLRFFTVYGPAGRHDMAYFGSTNKLLKGKTIEIFNYGNCQRDFTSIDDIVDGVIRVVQGAPEKETGEDGLPIHPTRCTISAIRTRKIYWISWIFRSGS